MWSNTGGAVPTPRIVATVARAALTPVAIVLPRQVHWQRLASGGRVASDRPVLRYDEADLVRRLERVPPGARVRFAEKCALRLFPRYEALAEVSASADISTMRSAIRQLANALHDSRPVEVGDFIDRCTTLVPDDDNEAPAVVVALADHAAAAVAYALRCYRSGAAQEAAWAARRAYEAADLVAVEDLGIDLNSPRAEERVLAHEAVQLELASQERDLRELGA